MKKKLLAVLKALASPSVRPAELVLARVIVAALGVKLGINLADYFK